MNNQIKKYRTEINRIDKEIIELLSSRIEISKKIGQEKIIHNYPITDKKRERSALIKRQFLASKTNLDQKFIKEIFKLIFKYSKRVQQKHKQHILAFDKKG